MAYWHDCWQQNNVASIGDDGKSVICFSFSLSIRYLSVWLSPSNFLPAFLSAFLAFVFFFFYLSLKAFVYVSYCMIVSVCLLILFCFHLPRPASEPSKIVVVSSRNKLGCLVANQFHSWLSQPVNWKEASMMRYALLYITTSLNRNLSKSYHTYCVNAHGYTCRQRQICILHMHMINSSLQRESRNYRNNEVEILVE